MKKINKLADDMDISDIIYVLEHMIEPELIPDIKKFSNKDFISYTGEYLQHLTVVIKRMRKAYEKKIYEIERRI